MATVYKGGGGAQDDGREKLETKDIRHQSDFC